MARGPTLRRSNNCRLSRQVRRLPFPPTAARAQWELNRVLGAYIEISAANDQKVIDAARVTSIAKTGDEAVGR